MLFPCDTCNSLLLGKDYKYYNQIDEAIQPDQHQSLVRSRLVVRDQVIVSWVGDEMQANTFSMAYWVNRYIRKIFADFFSRRRQNLTHIIKDGISCLQWQ